MQNIILDTFVQFRRPQTLSIQPHLMTNYRAQVQTLSNSFNPIWWETAELRCKFIFCHSTPILTLSIISTQVWFWFSFLILTYRKSAGLENEVQEVGVNNAARAAHDPPHVDHQVHINVDDPSLELPEQVAWSWAGVGQREEPRLQHQDHHRPPSLEGEWQEWAGADSWDISGEKRDRGERSRFAGIPWRRSSSPYW